MATRTKPPAAKKPAPKKRTPGRSAKNAPHILKAVGEPIDKNKVYTVSQLRRCLGISRPTLHRYVHDLGMQQFTSPLQGKAWQITGENYHRWLDWRREQAIQSAESHNA